MAWSDSDGREIQAERDKLRAELAGLRTGYDAQNNVIAGLKAESEEIEKAAMSYGEDLQWHTYELERVKADRDALSQDAHRYRWLRDESESINQFYLSTPAWFTGVKFSKENVDRTIDAAMTKEKSE